MSGENKRLEWGETETIFFGVISFIQRQSKEAESEAEKILDDFLAKHDKEILSRLHETAKMHRSIAEAAENLAFVWERQRKKTNRMQHETV